MGYAGRGGVSKYEYCSVLAVAMSLLLVRQGDRPGLVIAGQEPARALAPERTWRQVHAVSEELSNWRPRSSSTIASATAASSAQASAGDNAVKLTGTLRSRRCQGGQSSLPCWLRK